MALSLGDAISHHNEKHAGLTMLFVCRRCQKPYRTKHAALCHVPKCPGAKDEMPFSCTECTESFGTMRGLSQHKRHRHPAVRNLERETPAPARSAIPRIGSKFTAEEISLMYKLERIHKGDPNIAQKMAEQLKEKTAKQIRDKRREPAYCRNRDQFLREAASSLPGTRRRSRPSLSDASLSTDANVMGPGNDSVAPRRDAGVSAKRGTALSGTPEFGVDCGDDVVTLTGNFTRAIDAVRLRDCAVSLSRCDHLIGSRRTLDRVLEPGVRPIDSETASGEVVPPVDDAAVPEDRGMALEKCDHSEESPPLAEHERDAAQVGLNEPRWRELLVDSLVRWDTSKCPGDMVDACEAVRAAGCGPSVESVEAAYAAVARYFGAEQGPARAGDRPPRSRQRTKRGLKRYQYARTQDLYKKDPGLLARHVRRGSDHTAQNATNISRSDVRDLYGALWGTKVPTRTANYKEVPSVGLENFGPITAADVKRRLTRTKKSTAPGPDGIKRDTLRGVHRNGLVAEMFNLILASGVLPTPWRRNRTTLIPKEGKDSTKVINYRPLTISSLLSRLFWGIMDERLRSVVRIDPRQKGFVAEAGCFANVQILHELTCHMKQTRGGVGIQLDVSKAFDTVPHDAMPGALRRKGIPEPIVDLICSSYRNIVTTIAHPNGGIDIELQRGVKQGDPLSPLLFNLVIEPILEKLELMPGYPLPGDSNISCLAFADDLFLFASDPQRAQALLDCTVDELGALGMTIAASKSCAYQIKPTRDSWCMVDPGMERTGERIPACTPDSRITYLGCSYAIWSGFDTSMIGEHLTQVIERVKALRLKPMQKVNLLQTYLVPHYLHQLVISLPARTFLDAMDQELRVAVKQVLHLPQSICNGVIYCSRRDGGLGFPKMQELVPRISLLGGLKFAESSDPAIKALYGCSRTLTRLRRLANSVRINYPYTKSDIQKYKDNCRKAELKRWSELVSQGRAVESCAGDKIGNSFLRDPKLLKPCRFTTALQLRTNTAGNKTSLNRAIPQGDLSCRKCKTGRESLAHILGQCTHTKAARIRRHNEIRDYVEKVVLEKDGFAIVSKEPLIPLAEGGNLKPDLVIKNQSGVFVVDITVRHEDGDYLLKAKEEKVGKYTRLLPQLQKQFDAERGDVLPIVVGTRGAMPKDTCTALATLKMGLSKHLKTISLMALRSSIEIYHAFLDYDGPLL